MSINIERRERRKEECRKYPTTPFACTPAEIRAAARSIFREWAAQRQAFHVLAAQLDDAEFAILMVELRLQHSPTAGRA
jgi:hypothetical protein